MAGLPVRELVDPLQAVHPVFGVAGAGKLVPVAGVADKLYSAAEPLEGGKELFGIRDRDPVIIIRVDDRV